MPALVSLQLLFEVGIFAFAFGTTNKLADMHNEHGLRLFKYGAMAFGVLTGLVGIMLMSLETNLAGYYVATTFDWFMRGKLDRPSHTTGGAMLLFAGFFYLDKTLLPLVAVLSVTLAITGLLLHGPHNKFLKRARFILIALAFSVVVQDYAPLVASVMGIVGVEAIVRLYREYEGNSAITPLHPTSAV